MSIGAPALLSSSARTPALASAGAGVEVGFGPGAFFRPTPRNTDPINDVVSSSPPFAEQRPGAVGGGGGKRRDFIDFDVDVSVEEDADADANEDEEAVPESSPIRGSSRRGASSDPEEHDIRSRSPKRRRISISSDFGIESSQHEHEGVLLEHGPRDEQDIDMIESSLPLPLPLPQYLSLPDRHVPPPSDDAEAEAEAEGAVTFSPPYSPYSPSSPSLLTPKLVATVAQPTFQKPPRFKPAAGTETLDGSHQHHDYSHEPPPDVFSPHRRRDAKYVRGGLAAEVRDWFVDIWAGTGTVTARREGWTARLRVDEARGAPGAVLVTGRHVRDDDADGSGNGDGDGGSRGSVRVVLAGSPRLTGLAKGEEVRQGLVVGIGKPTWEVSIQDQGRWAVVCEWAVLS